VNGGSKCALRDTNSRTARHHQHDMIRQRPYTPAGKLQRTGAAKPTFGKDKSQVLWERAVGITAAVALFLCATLSLSVRYRWAGVNAIQIDE
jgi:hypothetical protein